MITEVTDSLGKLQAYLADQGLLDEATVERLKSMPTIIAAMKQQADERSELLEKYTAALESAQQVGVDLTAKGQTVTDRIDVLERQMYGRKSERTGNVGRKREGGASGRTSIRGRAGGGASRSRG